MYNFISPDYKSYNILLVNVNLKLLLLLYEFLWADYIYDRNSNYYAPYKILIMMMYTTK